MHACTRHGAPGGVGGGAGRAGALLGVARGAVLAHAPLLVPPLLAALAAPAPAVAAQAIQILVPSPHRLGRPAHPGCPPSPPRRLCPGLLRFHRSLGSWPVST